jgi:hypothetical protein
MSKSIRHILLLLLYELYQHHQKLNLQFEFQQPTRPYLAVFKPVGLDVQVEPSYSSVAPVTAPEPGSPPKANAAV